MPRLTFAEAVQQALAEEMERDATIWVLGEDMHFGGVFGQYKGLVERFGRERVVDTPISEATIMGAGLGAALAGTRPVIEMRIADFALPAMDELVNQIAKIRYMTGGQARPALVVRMPHGLLPGSAAQHSQTIENWLVNLPGIVVLAPATAADLAAALKTALRGADPYVILEPKSYYRSAEDVPETITPLEVGRAVVRREGSDVTLVTWSQGLRSSLAGAAAAAEKGVSVEVIDLVSLWPWDRPTVARSVARTGRLLVAQEGGVDGGFGSEVVASVLEDVGPQAIKTVKRVGAPRIPIPFAISMEQAVTLTREKVTTGIAAVMRA